MLHSEKFLHRKLKPNTCFNFKEEYSSEGKVGSYTQMAQAGIVNKLDRVCGPSDASSSDPFQTLLISNTSKLWYSLRINRYSFSDLYINTGGLASDSRNRINDNLLSYYVPGTVYSALSISFHFTL